MPNTPDITPEATAARIVAEWRAHWVHGSTDPLVAAIAAAIKAERESCAKVADDAETHQRRVIGHTPADRIVSAREAEARAQEAHQIAAAIRGRL